MISASPLSFRGLKSDLPVDLSSQTLQPLLPMLHILSLPLVTNALESGGEYGRKKRQMLNAPRMPAKKPAAQPPAAPFRGSFVCREFATKVSVYANVAPMAAASKAAR